MFAAALPPGRVEVLELLAHIQGLKSFYLAGGTVVALYLGHRISKDFDFFTPQESNSLSLRGELHNKGDFILTDMKNCTLHGIFNGVKVSFLYYAALLIFPPVSYYDCPVADLPDLAPIKLDTLGFRGSKKNFIDLFLSVNRYHSGVFSSFTKKNTPAGK